MASKNENNDDDGPAVATVDVDVDDPYKSSSFVGHSLWMVPSGESNEYRAYSSIISKHARELNTIEFVPHITLVAAIMMDAQDVVERTKELASRLSAETETAPLQYHLDKLSYRDAYFQCVYVEMKRTTQVLAANALAREVFSEKRSDPPYMPHLSLVYGDLDKEFKVSTLIPRLEEELSNTGSTAQTLTMDSIEVWSTQGHVQEWYRVATVPLLTGHEKKKKTKDDRDEMR